MGEDLQRAALARIIASRLPLASHDELRVLDVVLTRLERRRDRAGPLEVNSPRDFRAELGEGLLDATIYCAIETLRLRDAEHAELRDEAAEELAELERWRQADQRTRVSTEPARIALEHDPYDDLAIAVVEIGGEGG
jgi:hypothetical protein